jgi:hypothetical protein
VRCGASEIANLLNSTPGALAADTSHADHLAMLIDRSRMRRHGDSS